jgi:hypothetical protein
MNHSLNLRTQVLTIFDLSFDESVDKANICGGSNTLDTAGGGKRTFIPPCPGSRPPNATRPLSFGGEVRTTERAMGIPYGSMADGSPVCIDWRFFDDEPYSERKKPWWNPF